MVGNSSCVECYWGSISDIQLWIICVISQIDGKTSGAGDVTTRKLKSMWGGAGAIFLSFSKALCVSVTYMFCESCLLLFVKVTQASESSSMSKATFKTNKGESRSSYRLCVPPCPCYITSGDTHSLCLVCLGVKHAESALEGAGSPHCERLPPRTLRSRRVLFEEGAFTSIPRGAGPASAKAEQQLHSWGSQLDLAERMEMGRSLSSSSPARSTVRSLRSEARSAVSSPQRAGSALLLSSSEGVYVESADYSPIQSPQYEELLEAAELNIDWPAENQTEPQKSKLDERFLRTKSLPPCQSLPFLIHINKNYCKYTSKLNIFHQANQVSTKKRSQKLHNY